MILQHLLVTYKTGQIKKFAKKRFAEGRQRSHYSVNDQLKKTFISLENKKARLEFVKAHLNWSVQKWMPVLFSNESKLNLKDSGGIRRVRRSNGQRLNSKYCKGTVKHGSPGVISLRKGLGQFIRLMELWIISCIATY